MRSRYGWNAERWAPFPIAPQRMAASSVSLLKWLAYDSVGFAAHAQWAFLIASQARLTRQLHTPGGAEGGMDLNASVGSLFIGYAVSLWLYGITMSQIGLFLHRSSANKSLFLRTIAWTFFVLENAQTILISHGIWLYTVSYHGRPQKLATPTRSFGILVYITSVNNGIVRCVYAYRIYKLSGGHAILPALVVILSLMVAVLACIYGTQGDCIITASMVYLFARRNVGYRQSDHLAQTLMIYFLNSGLLVMICVICSIVAYVAIPSSFAFLAFYLALGKLYANSLLGSLNARDIIFPRASMELSVPTVPLLTSIVVLDTDDRMLETTMDDHRELDLSCECTSETRLEPGPGSEGGAPRGVDMIQVRPTSSSMVSRSL
ncbi:hypothetical protein OH77DRAFT_141537 [Trametes cingulata]|nr:hypothetical protein OH77DRAFT_141537 [Trametes cingulata]